MKTKIPQVVKDYADFINTFNKLKRYISHFSWCRSLALPKQDCNCGLLEILEEIPNENIHDSN